MSLAALSRKLRMRESLHRLDTRLCFALAHEGSGLKARLLKQRCGIEAQCEDMELEAPNKLLPTPVLRSKKHTVELEISKAQLQLPGKPTDTQVKLREALEREPRRRLPQRREEQAKEKTRLREFSSSEFLEAYRACAQQLYAQASTPDTPYESLVSLWEKWQIYTQEAEKCFGDAWLWQYI